MGVGAGIVIFAERAVASSALNVADIALSAASKLALNSDERYQMTKIIPIDLNIHM